MIPSSSVSHEPSTHSKGLELVVVTGHLRETLGRPQCHPCLPRSQQYSPYSSSLHICCLEVSPALATAAADTVAAAAAPHPALLHSSSVGIIMQGPAPPPHMSLPSNLVFNLTGHEGPVLNVRFNPKGTYCISCGKVGGCSSLQDSSLCSFNRQTGFLACQQQRQCWLQSVLCKRLQQQHS